MTDTSDDGDLLTIEQVAERLGWPVKTLYTRRRAGTLPPPDKTYGRLMLWRWATITGANLPPRRTRTTGRPQA